MVLVWKDKGPLGGRDLIEEMGHRKQPLRFDSLAPLPKWGQLPIWNPCDQAPQAPADMPSSSELYSQTVGQNKPFSLKFLLVWCVLQQEGK